MAFSYHHVIPESVYAITSASTRRTYSFSTDFGLFSYRTLKPTLFFGYELLKTDNKTIKIASLEKALLDYLYIHTDLKTHNDFISLRLNADLCTQKIRKDCFFTFLEKFKKKSLETRANILMEVIAHA